MSPLARQIRQTLTIARRDFIATVFTPVFLIFLFAPAIMGSFGAIGGLGAAAAGGGGASTRLVAIVAPDDQPAFLAADKRLRAVFRDSEAPPALTTLAPAADLARQAQGAVSTPDGEAAAVMFGPLARPHILVGDRGDRSAAYLTQLADETLAAERLGSSAPHAAPIRIALPHAPVRHGARTESAFAATFGIFFLTLFLAGQVVGTMAEERNNKVIEVLAAAVPLESVFAGKLLGMFGVAIVFVAFWGSLFAGVGSVAPAFAAALAHLSPAVGPMFPILFFAYFTMAYLLLGAVFLGVGAQATTPREIQMLSLPITILQVAMFALAAAAASRPGSTLALVAELFPLSSPFAMVGRAAGVPGLWPHVAALAWQLLWVAVFITIGARAFRRGVLQSGSARPRWSKANRAADMAETGSALISER